MVALSVLFWIILLIAVTPLRLEVWLNTADRERVRVRVSAFGFRLIWRVIVTPGERPRLTGGNLPARWLSGVHPGRMHLGAAMHSISPILRAFTIKRAAIYAVFGGRDAAASAVLCGALSGILGGLRIPGCAICDFSREGDVFVGMCMAQVKIGHIIRSIIKGAME